jgi:tetratricopeptide (TPR) repeat protein
MLAGLIEARRAAPNPAAALNDLAAESISPGDYDLTLAAATEARAAALRRDDANELARAQTFQGQACLYRGEYARASGFFREALATEQKRGDLHRQVQRWNNIGLVHFYQGRYDEALAAYREAARLIEVNPGRAWQPAADRLTTANLATVYQKLGRLELALACYRRMRAAGARLEPREESEILSSLGSLQRRMGDPVRALALYRQAIDLYRRDGSAGGEIGNLKNAGILLALDRGDLPAAEHAFREALRLAEASGNVRETMQCRLYLGETLLRAGRGREAAAEWNGALHLARRLGAVEDMARAHTGLGRVVSETVEAEAAIEFEAAAAALESVRGRLDAPSLRAEFLSGRRELFDAWIGMLAANSRAEAILAVMERARARTLQERRRRALAGTQPPALRDLAAALARLSAERGRATGDTTDLDRRIFAAEQRYQREEEKGSRQAGGSAAGSRPLPVAALRAALPEDAGLYSLWLAGERLHTVLLTPDITFHRSLPFPPARAAQVRAFLAALRDPASDWRTPARQVGEWLLPPLPQALKRLAVVSDLWLGLIPFEALVNPATGNALVRGIEISYLPAASLWHPGAGRTWRPPWAPSVAAFAGPPGGQLLPGDENWDPLPAAAAEASFVSTAFGGVPALNPAPAEESWSVAHFAVHAVADAEDSGRSRLLLPSGYLFQSEIETLTLRGFPMVTLSACESALGARGSLEGGRSLSHAFLGAGAGAVTASLWKVEDRAALAFMERWYARLAAGEAAAAALRAVKIEVLDAGHNPASHPARWAAFVLEGDPGWRAPRFVSWEELAVAVAAFFVLALWFLVVRPRPTTNRKWRRNPRPPAPPA